MSTATKERYTPPPPPADADEFTRESFRPRERGFVGQLVENRHSGTDAEFNKKHKLPKALLRWYQVIADQGAEYEDGNPVANINHVFLQTMDGDPVSEASQAGMLAEAFNEVCGCDMMPANPDSAGYIGHFFRFENRKVGEGEKKSFYLSLPVEYLGDEYEHTGRKRIVKSKQDGGSRRSRDEDEDEDAPATGSDDVVTVAQWLNGQQVGDLKPGLINGTPLHDIKTIGGVSIRGGLSAGPGGRRPLIEKLVALGAISVDDDGVIHAEVAG